MSIITINVNSDTCEGVPSLGEIMATLVELQASVDALAPAVAAVSAKIDVLVAGQGGAASEAELDVVKSGVDAAVASLTTLAA